MFRFVDSTLIPVNPTNLEKKPHASNIRVIKWKVKHTTDPVETTKSNSWFFSSSVIPTNKQKSRRPHREVYGNSSGSTRIWRVWILMLINPNRFHGNHPGLLRVRFWTAELLSEVIERSVILQSFRNTCSDFIWYQKRTILIFGIHLTSLGIMGIWSHSELCIPDIFWTLNFRFQRPGILEAYPKFQKVIISFCPDTMLDDNEV